MERFLEQLGLESCVQAVVHNGFYTSMEALRGANYEELVDLGVRPVHAKLILSNLGSKGDGIVCWHQSLCLDTSSLSSHKFRGQHIAAMLLSLLINMFCGRSPSGTA